MGLGSNYEIDVYARLDIDGDSDIVRLNNYEVDNKTRGHIGDYLRSAIFEQRYHFDRSVHINPDETLKIEIIGENIDFDNIDSLYIGDLEFKRKRFKSRYDNVRTFLIIKNGECSYCLKEGYRYLSPEESCHVVDLVYKSNGNTFYFDMDLWVKVQKKEW